MQTTQNVPLAIDAATASINSAASAMLGLAEVVAHGFDLPIPLPAFAATASTMPAALNGFQTATEAVADAFAAVAGFLRGAVAHPQTQRLEHAALADIQPSTIPESQVAPTLTPAFIEAADIEAGDMHERIAETDNVERIEVAAYRGTDVLDPEFQPVTEDANEQRDYAGEDITRRHWEEENEREAAADLALPAHVEDIPDPLLVGAGSNGHVEPGHELGGVGGSATTTGTRKKGGKGRGRGRS